MFCSLPMIVALGVLSESLETKDRVIEQQGGDWIITYRFVAKEDVSLEPKDMGASSEGWVSNSSAIADINKGERPNHGTPMFSKPSVSGSARGSAILIPDNLPDAKMCKECLTLSVEEDAKPTTLLNDDATLRKVHVEKDKLLRVRVLLQHDHFLLGKYHVLLGTRTIVLRLGSVTIKDTVALDREYYFAQGEKSFDEVPEERCDNRHYVSPPHSLLLDCTPGQNYFRFSEIPVRHGEIYELSFWYFVAPGSEGDFMARTAQYQESPNAWKVLSEGGNEFALNSRGKWVHVRKMIKMECQATTFALDFRLKGAEVAEAWVDDVKMEPCRPGKPKTP